MYDARFYQFSHDGSADFGTSVQSALPNLQYASNGHPSDIAVAYDASSMKEVYVDSVFPADAQGGGDEFATGDDWSSGDGTAKPRAYAKSAQAGAGIPLALHSAVQGHLWGWSTCHWIRPCNTATEKVGTPCSATLAGVLYEGYCFESSSSSLECGHTTALDSSIGDRPIVIGEARSPNKLPSQAVAFSGSSTLTFLPMAPYRCERGADATATGSHVGKRLPIAGCMISSDPAYDAMADVHVPDYCDVPASFHPGCMIEGGWNYDPTAKQPTHCYYRTPGCTNSSAANYDPEAAIDDGSCIAAIVGCTIANETYAGVDVDTPGYKSGFYGGARTNQGQVQEAWFANDMIRFAAVTNYDPTANVLGGCIVAIEGCMDPTAANYESYATKQSSTWCIPVKVGCMMPNGASAGASYTPSKGKSGYLGGNWKDGLAANFDPSASVHNPSACIRERIGCMSTTIEIERQGEFKSFATLNYDPLATVAGDCYADLQGCLNPIAKNYGCPDLYDAQGNAVYTKCVDGAGLPNAGVHDHVGLLCNWEEQPPAPPAPPPPPLEAGKKVLRVPKTIIGMVAKGSVEDFGETALDSLAENFASIAGTTKDQVEVTVTAASVYIAAAITFTSLDAANAAATSISSALGSTPASASALLGIEVLSVPVVEAKVVAVIVDGTDDNDGPNVGAIVGGASGGSLLLILVCVCIINNRKPARIAVVDVEPEAAYDYGERKQAWGGDD